MLDDIAGKANLQLITYNLQPTSYNLQLISYNIQPITLTCRYACNLFQRQKGWEDLQCVERVQLFGKHVYYLDL